MQLSEEQRAHVNAWLNATLPSRDSREAIDCPACEAHSWNVRGLIDNLTVAPDQLIPALVVVSCGGCHEVRFFDAHKIGVVLAVARSESAAAA